MNPLRDMKALLLSSFVLLAATLCRAHLHDHHDHIHGGHVDFSFCFENGVWRTGLVWHNTTGGVGQGAAQGQLRAADSAVIVLEDQPFETGNRVRRPLEPEWAFTGVGPGEPFWWIPQSAWSGGAWTGFNVCGGAGSGCSAYFEPDPRVNATAEWKTMELKSVRYLGKGSGQFSMWTSGTFGDLLVWMTTVDGITEQDRYFIGNAGHAHPSFGFSALGLYEVTFCTTCYGGPGKTNPNTSPPVSFYFAVGTYWEWVSRHLSPDRWWQQGYTGEMDDPDGDRIPNVMEYAFGLHPREAARSETPGLGAPGLPSLREDYGILRYALPLRDPATNPQIEVTVQGTEDPAADPWPQTLTPTQSPTGFTGWLAGECVLDPQQTPRRFLRTAVRLLPEILYND